jgi:hypothetical protein
LGVGALANVRIRAPHRFAFSGAYGFYGEPLFEEFTQTEAASVEAGRLVERSVTPRHLSTIALQLALDGLCAVADFLNGLLQLLRGNTKPGGVRLNGELNVHELAVARRWFADSLIEQAPT